MNSQSDDGNRSDEMENSTTPTSLTYHILGSEYMPVSPNDTEIFFNTGRIHKIENLEQCHDLKSLSLIAQLIDLIEGLDANNALENLELYQNNIKKIVNIKHLINLKVLDLSFNEIRKIENIETLVNLEKLFLSNNKITKIEGIDTLVKLQSVELGGNRLRIIENLDKLVELRELWLGKNKITSMAIPHFPNLSRISIQSNRLIHWDPSIFLNAPKIEELYLGHNRLSEIPREIKNLTDLRVLDLAGNQISVLESLSACLKLEELWFNDNLIASKGELQHLKLLKKLDTVYLERNPIQNSLGPGYRTAVTDALPWLKQLDAILLNSSINVTVHHDEALNSV